MDGASLFWDIAAEMYEDAAVERSTMMGFPCLRVHGGFFAMMNDKTGELIVKQNRSRVQELIDEGLGESFAPAGKVFKEWVAVPDADEDRWRKLMADAKSFVAGG